MIVLFGRTSDGCRGVRIIQLSHCLLSGLLHNYCKNYSNNLHSAHTNIVLFTNLSFFIYSPDDVYVISSKISLLGYFLSDC